jgi:phage terminase large subunit GpA-like protein
MMLKPTRLPSYENFARTITLPDGKSKDLKYRPESHQCQLAFLRELDKGWIECTVVKPVQDGGTLVTLIPLFRRAVCQYQTVVLAYPTNDSAKDIWTTKISPILKAYGGIEPKGAGRNGAAKVVQLPTGGQFILRSAGGRGESGQASVTGDCLEIDEVDDWHDLHRVQLITKRIEESPDPLIMNVCTVKRQQNSLILAKYNAGSKARMYYACPYCGHYQTLEWEQVKWKVRDEYFCVEDSEYIECANPHCKEAIFEPARRRLLANWKLLHDGQTIGTNGTVQGTPNNQRHFSILWTRLDSPRKTLRTTIDMYMEAKQYLEQSGEHGHMKSFTQDYLCRQYTGDLDELETNGILNHNHLIMKSSLSEWGTSLVLSDAEVIGGQDTGLYSRHVSEPPQAAEYSIATIDVQHNRVYWVLVGFDKNGSQYDYAWGFEFGRGDRKSLNEAELFELLDRTSRLMSKYAGHTDLVLGGIDCADQADSVRMWVMSNSHLWRSVRGAGTKMKVDNEQDIDGISYVRDGVIIIHTDNVRDMVHAAVRRPNSAPGSISFPMGIGQNQSGYFRHLVSKQTTIDPKTKKKIIHRGAGREDWLDCRIYNFALMTGFIQAIRLRDVRNAVNSMKKHVNQQLSHEKEVEKNENKGENHVDKPPGQAVVTPNGPVRIGGPALNHRVEQPRSGAHMRNNYDSPGRRSSVMGNRRSFRQ